MLIHVLMSESWIIYQITHRCIANKVRERELSGQLDSCAAPSDAQLSELKDGYMELLFFICHFQVQVHWCLYSLASLAPPPLCLSCKKCLPVWTFYTSAPPAVQPAARESRVKQRRDSRVRMNGHTVNHANISYVVRDFVSPSVAYIRKPVDWQPIREGMWSLQNRRQLCV